MGSTSPYRMPLEDPVSDEASLQLLSVLPEGARRTARAAGLEPLLVDLLRARDAAPPSAADLSALHQQLHLRLIALDTQVSAFSFEVGCMHRRLDDMISFLEDKEVRRQVGLTVASLVTAAATVVVASVMDEAEPTEDIKLPAWISAAGGLATAGIGAAALMVPERAVRLEHPRNLLLPVWRGADLEHLYPSFVFRTLTQRFPGDAQVPRDHLLRDLDDILRKHIDKDQREQALTMLASEGGVYPRELLKVRADMFSALEQAVAGVARDLELLQRSLVSLFAPPFGPPPRLWKP